MNPEWLSIIDTKIAARADKLEEGVHQLRTEFQEVLTEVQEAKNDQLLAATTQSSMLAEIKTEMVTNQTKIMNLIASLAIGRAPAAPPAAGRAVVQQVADTMGGSAIFLSEPLVIKMIEKAQERSRVADQAALNLAGGVRTAETYKEIIAKGAKQRAAFELRIEKICWTGKKPILLWVQEVGDIIADVSLDAVTLEFIKGAIWRGIHELKRSELNHIRPGTPAHMTDSIAEYVARIASTYEPEAYSERFRDEYDNRKQLRKEAPQNYVVDKWQMYEQAEPNPYWAQFMRDAIKGFCNYRLQNSMRRDIRLLSDMGKFQNAIHEEVANLRREAVSTLHPIGSLVGLKVTESSLEWQHPVAGTWPMEVDSLDAPDVEYGEDDMEVAALQHRDGCWNCHEPGHTRANCTKPKRTATGPPAAGKKTRGSFPCRRCKKKGHPTEMCGELLPACTFCKWLGHLEKDCRKKQNFH